MIEYPNKLNIIFDKLLNNSIKPIIIGGYIRDFLLKIESKDVDIELYGISSFSKLEDILQEFGSVNSVGKSFGVCKLTMDDLDIDFSFPRTDSKIQKGHKGFEVDINAALDFKTAASRRDFTINAIGYDIQTKKILDPFNGVKDLENGILRAVDINKFADDPLRVLRAAQFASRFNLSIDNQLLSICQKMVNNSLLNELPHERIFTEIKKLLLKSPKPSLGMKLLKQFNAFDFFKELKELNSDELTNTLNSLDRMSSLKTTNQKTNTVLMLAVLCYKLPINRSESFLLSLSTEKSLINNILSLLTHQDSFNFNEFIDYDVYLLATKVNIDEFALFCLATSESKDKLENISKLRERAEKLNVLSTKAAALLQGRDILALEVEPSKEFSKILNKAYLAQISGKFKTKQEALIWLKKELTT